MKKQYYIILSIVIVSVVIISGIRFFSGEDDWICQSGEWVRHGNPSAEKPVGNCEKILENRSIPAKDKSHAVEEKNIIVFNPAENTTVNSPLYVEGKARVFENVVNIRLKDKEGKILFQGNTDAQSPEMGQYGLFKKEIKYATSQTEGTLEVFESSAKDGSEINKIVIPVKFGNGQSK